MTKNPYAPYTSQAEIKALSRLLNQTEKDIVPYAQLTGIWRRRLLSEIHSGYDSSPVEESKLGESLLNRISPSRLSHINDLDKTYEQIYRFFSSTAKELLRFEKRDGTFMYPGTFIDWLNTFQSKHYQWPPFNEEHLLILGVSSALFLSGPNSENLLRHENDPATMLQARGFLDGQKISIISQRWENLQRRMLEK